jgi:ABC-type glycerol-3-phosphate transport system permease component
MARVGKWLGGALVWLWAAFIVFVFVWLVFSSVKDNRELFSNMWSLPSHLQLENYKTAWSAADLTTAFRNSVVVVTASVFAIVAVSAPASYVLSRIPFKGASLITTYFIVGIGIPVEVILIPLFTMMARMRLVNSLWGLGLVYVSLSLPFTIYLLTGFFRSLPIELEEAAAIDGAGPFLTFFRVMMPLARPGLVTAAVLNAVGLWNEYLLALVLLNDNAKYTLSLGILNMYASMRYTSNWVGLFAGVVIVVLPVALIYAWLSNRIIEGLTLGSGK